MGPGVCGSRRQKGLLQTGFCILALLCLGTGVFLYQHLQQKVRSSETLSLKFKQQQEALSAQLQVVYEHRSRLERSLQKERGEHKKTKEDFLVYKLEAQEALNKEKQDAMNRYGALSSQHKILKNQHEEVKKQLLDMQVQHNSLKLQNRKAVEGHSQKYLQLQQEKEDQVISLQDTVSKLREESKLLRKAHQDVHTQLRDAQVQLEEFRQLKEALQRMPSFKELGITRGHQPFQLMATDKKLFRARGAETQPLRQQEEKRPEAILPPGTPTDSGSKTAAGGGGQPPGADGEAKIQGHAVFGPPDLLPPWPAKGNDGHIQRFTRTVNSLQAGDGDQKLAASMPGEARESRESPGEAAPQEKPALGSEQPPEPPEGQLRVQSWQDIINKVNARMDEEQEPLPRRATNLRNAHLQLANPAPRMEGQAANQEEENKEVADDEELEMDAGMIDREEIAHSRREAIAQEPMMPEDAPDPAQDPNNQGEDEFEEAALERPAFAVKAARVDRGKDSKQPVRAEPLKNTKEAALPDKAEEETVDDYQEDQEQEREDHGGDIDDNDDLQLAHEKQSPGEEPKGNYKKDDYY